ncbi:MAG TPA: response regulator [Lacunisphaera sp.]|jgi:CheY-like chemotaxis protein|nr:response regulator [Lacunisphaera sp.]
MPTPPATSPSGSGADRHWRGHGRVLVVDDEDTVRLTAGEIIRFFGFEVEGAASGARALELLRAADQRFDLVLLDLTMPGMDGYATFTAIRELLPAQPIVVFSGYTVQDAHQRFAGRNLNGFLQKPFSVESLRDILRRFSRK